MNAYIASIEIEMPIIADSKEEAAKLAKKYFNDELDGCSPSDIDFNIQLMKRCPDGSTMDSYCWSNIEKGEFTVKEGIGLNLSKMKN
jgi:hypothetical protein